MPLLPRFLLALLLFGSLRLASGTVMVSDQIDWPQFLARHDLLWDQMPTNINNGPIIGNGWMSCSIQKEGNALSWQMFRIDVTDHRTPKDRPLHPLYDTPRLAIGRFQLSTVGKVQDFSMRVQLWDALCSGEIKTDKGTISWRAFVPYNEDLIVVDFKTTGAENGFDWKWVPYLSSGTRYLGKMLGLKKLTPEQLAKADIEPAIKDYQPNPDVVVSEQDNLIISKHPLLAGGHFAVACRTEKPANDERIVRISVQPPGDHAVDAAIAAVKNSRSVDDLLKAHTDWWHHFYQASFVSIPDTRLEGHYWIQNYKLASLTRPGMPPIDVYGYGLPNQYSGWPNIWWNMNVQENYYGCFTANHLELGESLSGSLEKYADNLSKNIPNPEWQKDSAWMGRVSDQQLRTEVKLNPDGSMNFTELELADLSWAMELYHRQCRYAADDERLKSKFLPLLEKCVNFYRHVLIKGNDGKWHMPKAISPEIGSDSDLNYDLAALHWDLDTLITEYTRLGIPSPQMGTWRQLKKDLADFPVGANGLKIGANRELTNSHRHYSHLLGIYPLYILDWDNPSQRDLIRKSVDYWYGLFTDPEKKHENLFGYSQTGAASMFASMGRGNDALAALDGYLNYNATFNAFYREGTIEVPFSVSQSTHELMLQSRKGIIRFFPAMPSSWKDAVFENLRTEGSFLVSGRWRESAVDWIRIKSLAGEPCSIRVHFDQAPLSTLTTKPVNLGNDTYKLSLKKGEEAILYTANRQPDFTVKPLAGNPAEYHYFGYTKEMVERKNRQTVQLTTKLKNDSALPSGKPILLEGSAAPNSSVIVRFDNQGKKTITNSQGNWQIILDPLKPNDRKQNLEITGEYGDQSVRNLTVAKDGH